MHRGEVTYLKTRNKEVLSFYLNSKSYFSDGLVKPKSCDTFQDVFSGALNSCNLKDRYFSPLGSHRICKTRNTVQSFIEWGGKKKKGSHQKKQAKPNGRARRARNGKRCRDLEAAGWNEGMRAVRVKRHQSGKVIHRRTGGNGGRRKWEGDSCREGERKGQK